MPKKTAVGVVTGDKASKTRRVELPRLVRHPKYGKILHRKTVCHVHDEQEQSHLGDTVEIVECRPRSRTKRFELLRIVKRGEQVEAEPPALELAGELRVVAVSCDRVAQPRQRRLGAVVARRHEPVSQLLA